jgi:mRNA interferase MazF
MPSYSKNEVILIRYPFSTLSGSKVRPAAVVNAPHTSQDVIIVPLTSKVSSLLTGEFVLLDWKAAGLNVPSAAKRGLYTVHQSLIIKSIGKLSGADAGSLEKSLRDWLDLR